MKNKFLIILGLVSSALVVALFTMYYFLGIGFGKAVVKTAKGIREAKSEWKKKEINPIDSIKQQVVNSVDSSVLSNK